jgi:hypothetical protein
MSKSQTDDVNNKPPKIGDIDIPKIDYKARIHSTSNSARHIEQAQEKEAEGTEENERGSWQLKEK